MNITSANNSILISRPDNCDFDIIINPIKIAVSTAPNNLLSLDSTGFFAGLSGTGIVKSTSGAVTYITGTSSQFLKADGSLDSNVYLTSESDTLQSVTNRNSITTDSITAASFIHAGGTSSQFQKGDGSLDSNTYLITNQVITLSGDVTGSGSTGISVSIGAGKVTNTMLVNSSIIINTGTGLAGGATTSLGGVITLTNTAPDQVVTLTNGSGITITGTYPNFTISNSSTIVSSLTGTANQVKVNGTTGSAQTGAITLTTPQDIATTSDVTFNTATLGYTAAMLTTSQYGGISSLTLNTSATNSTQAFYGGLVGQLALNSSGTYTFDAKTAVGGLIGKTYIQSSGSYDKAAGVFSSGQFNNTPIITKYAGFYALSPYLTAAGSYSSGAITNYYGLYLEASDTDGTVSARITNKWGVYQSGANDINFLQGELKLGTGQVVSASSTNTVTNKVKLIINGITYYLLASTSGA